MFRRSASLANRSSDSASQKFRRDTFRVTRVTTSISCYRTPGPQKGFRRVSEGVPEGVSEGVSEGFFKGSRRVSEGSPF